MIQITNKTQCCGCGACANICPKHCIAMTADEEGFLYPSIDKSVCIDCNACVRVCQELNKPTGGGMPSAYAAYASYDNIRKESSSGGVFSVLASYVLKDNGVVFGAAFDEDFNVKHIFVDKEADMYKLRGSKYLQSRTEDCYAQAKKFLNEGRKVLYSGTPCQIAGLHNYLGRDYESLILVDFICHGTPSPLVWQTYLNSLPQASSRRKPRRISFRHKYYGWKRYSVSIKYDDTEYLCERDKDAFMRAFLSDMCLRPSCYNCPAKGMSHVSDFTIADFWGIQNVLPEMDDDKGTSLVFVHSEKGDKIFQAVQSKIIVKAVDCNVAVRYNPSMVRSVRKPDNRNKFMRAIENSMPFEIAVEKYCRKSKRELAVYFAKRFVKKIIRR